MADTNLDLIDTQLLASVSGGKKQQPATRAPGAPSGAPYLAGQPIKLPNAERNRDGSWNWKSNTHQDTWFWKTGAGGD